MPSFSQYVTNIPDNETIVSTAGKLAVNKGNLSLKYGSYGSETNKIYSDLVPIGTILPWAKSLTSVPALPENFVECNGQVLNDADSLLNGVTIPNLNANGGGSKRFLRGSTTSGTTGGADTDTKDTTNNLVGSTVQSGTGAQVSAYAHHHSTTINILPTYYEVVFIIRIK